MAHHTVNFEDACDSDCSTCCSALDSPPSPQRAAGGAGSPEPVVDPKRLPDRWQVVWCHEHCYKPPCAEWRNALAEASQEAGATLRCMKKAFQFVDWSAVHGNVPSVLLTDWREVKQCMEYVLQRCPQNKPMLTVVLCGNSKQYYRASSWAKGLAESSGRVHVRMDAASPKELISDLLAIMEHGQGHHESRAVMNGKPAALPARQARPKLAGLPGKVLAGAAPKNARMKVAQRLEEAIGLPWPVVEAMMPIWGQCGSPAEVERMLREAAPTIYED